MRVYYIRTQGTLLARISREREQWCVLNKSIEINIINRKKKRKKQFLSGVIRVYTRKKIDVQVYTILYHVVFLENHCTVKIKK